MGYPHSITSEVTYRYPLHHTQTMIKILAIAGSLRKDSNSKAILKTLYACLSVIVPAPEVAIPKVQEKLKDSRHHRCRFPENGGQSSGRPDRLGGRPPARTGR